MDKLAVRINLLIPVDMPPTRRSRVSARATPVAPRGRPARASKTNSRQEMAIQNLEAAIDYDKLADKVAQRLMAAQQNTPPTPTETPTFEPQPGPSSSQDEQPSAGSFLMGTMAGPSTNPNTQNSDSDVIQQLLKASLAPNTRKMYGRVLTNFNTYHKQKYAKPAEYPLDQQILAGYISHLFQQKYQAATIVSYISVLSFVHKMDNLPDPTNSFFVKQLLKGVKNTCKAPDTRLPITTNRLGNSPSPFVPNTTRGPPLDIAESTILKEYATTTTAYTGILASNANNSTLSSSAEEKIITTQNKTLQALPTPIKAKLLERYLHGYDEINKKYLIEGFNKGFALGIQGTVNPNHAKNHKSLSKAKIDKEIQLGRIMGPFNEPLENSVIFPLGLIPKKEANKFRLIHDLSHPEEKSINSYIPETFSRVQYENIENVISLVIKFGKHALMSIADIADAFRLIPKHLHQIINS
ncbi:uncharacterized protein LOC106180492 [Lingula anatina]|uniref:Uncharacterized protein LOC106180492 n=1 Tax=Lingula anatina TaxID=7574 RepID=A0A1S3KCJ8_LINAN|nr:uncharacterized protein LOC106180492 [Lingula anatina]|eukprot:XP_013419981.1 uncharacterized protein LOC106180492 [Lingula anatina]